MRHTIGEPTPVLTVTTRALIGDHATVVQQSLAALQETARRMEIATIGVPLRVDHGDDGVVELCLQIAALPDVDPPPPVAAEVLIPGTVVESLDEPPGGS